MSYELDQVVSVAVTLGTTGISQAGFGIPLIAGPNGTATSIQTISSASEMTTSYGYVITDPEYLKAVSLFAQQPSVSTVRIVTLPNGVSGTEKHFEPTGVWSASSFSLEVQGETVTEDFSTDEDTSYGNLAASIEALDDVFSASWNSIAGKLEVLSIDGSALSVKVLSFPTGVTALSQEVQVGSSTIESDLNTLTASDKEFYALLIASDADPDIKSALSYVNANSMLGFFKTNDVLAETPSETESLAYDLNQSNEDRAVLIYQQYSQRLEQADAGLAGIGLPQIVGSITWKFKQPVGVSPVIVSDGSNAELISKKVNLVVRTNSANFTKEGTCASGEFIDIIRGIDWLEARIQENILSLKLNNRKIPYTADGLALISNSIRQVLRLGVNNGLLATFQITLPEIADISSVDRINRVLKGVTFVATLQGAVHKTEITGTVSV